MNNGWKVRDQRTSNWLWCEKVVVDRMGHVMGPYGIAVYICLCRFANEDGACWPGYRTIASLTGMSRPNVKKYAKWLAALRLIDIQERSRDSGGGSTTNLFVLLDAQTAVGHYDEHGPPADFEFGGGVPPSRIAGGGPDLTPGGGSIRTEGGVLLEPGGGTSQNPRGVTTQPGGGSVVTPMKIDDGELALREGDSQKDKRAAVRAAYAWGWKNFFERQGVTAPKFPNLEDRKLERVIDYALRYQGLLVTCGAVRGIFFSAHNTGTNDRHELYLDITIALRPTNLLRFYYLWRTHRPAFEQEVETAGGAVAVAQRLGRHLADLSLPWIATIQEKLGALDGSYDKVERELLRLDAEMLSLADSSLTPAQILQRDTELSRQMAEFRKRDIPDEELEKSRRRIAAQIVRKLLALPTLSLYFDPLPINPDASQTSPTKAPDPDAWILLKDELKKKLDPEEYATWFRPLKAKMSGDNLVLIVWNDRVKATLEQAYGQAIEEAVGRLSVPPFQVLVSLEFTE